MNLNTFSVVLFAAALATASANGFGKGPGNRGFGQVPFGGLPHARFAANGFDGVRNFVPFNNEFPGRQQFQAPNVGGFVPGPSPLVFRGAGQQFQHFVPPQPAPRPAFGNVFPDNVASIAAEICPSYCYAQSGNAAQDVVGSVASPNTVTRVEKIVRTEVSKAGSTDNGILSAGSQVADKALGAVAAVKSNIGQSNAASNAASGASATSQVSVSNAATAQPVAAVTAAAPVVAAPAASTVAQAASSSVATSAVATSNSASSATN